MSKIKQVIKKFYKQWSMTEEEKYLSKSVDLVDLERRQRELNYKMSNKLGYWV